MGNIKYYLNKGKGTKPAKTENGKAEKPVYPIMIGYHVNGQRLFYYPGLWLKESEFNKASQAFPARPECIDRVYINNRLTLIRNMIGEIENEAIGRGETVTAELIRAGLNARLKAKPEAPDSRVTLLKYFDMFIEDTKTRTNERTGRKLSKAMPKKYGNVKNLFVDFCTFEGCEYDFADINEDFHKRFISYMVNEKQYAVNTYGRALKFLKTLLIKATKAGFNTNTYYLNITGTDEPADGIYLNEAELQKMYKLDLSDKPGLERVRDLFIIGCNTGLRFSDYITIKPEDVQGDRLRVVAQKTNRAVVIPLMPDAKAILQKYNFKLPKPISNQKFNEGLKEVAELAGLKETVVTSITKGGARVKKEQPKHELVTSHVARRSFATNYYKMGVDSLLIMAITGHKTEKEFLKYIKVTAEEKADMFEKVVQEKKRQKAPAKAKPKVKAAK